MAHLQYMPGDPRLVDQLVYELKSKGIFDQFRKDCIADVDTRPAYQNLRQRVENSVTTFLSMQTWQPDMNKNQLREKLRKHILDGNYLEQGVERIVDQVVNPKVATVFIPKVEDLVYKVLGITRKKSPSAETSNEKVEDLLPNDLEAVSPGSVKSNDGKSEPMDVDTSQDTKMDADEEKSKLESTMDSITIEMTIDNTQDIQLPCNKRNNDLDKSNIPLPTEEINPVNIPSPDASPPKTELEKIQLLKGPIISSTLPLPNDIGKEEKDQYFKPVISEDDDSSSDSSLRRNMSPLTPIRNFNNENSCDAQQAFESESLDIKNEDKTEPSSFRFKIDAKSLENSSDTVKVEKISEQFKSQVDINSFNTPLYEDSSNSNNLHIDYESDVNSKANIEIKVPENDQNSEDLRKEKKPEEKKSSYKSSHRSRDSHKHSSSKDKRSDTKHSNSKDNSRHDKSRSSKEDSKSKQSDKEKPKDKSEKKDISRESSSHRSSHKSSHKDSKSHRSSSSSGRHSSKHTDEKKSSSSSSHRDKDKSSDKSSSEKLKDSKSSSHKADKDRKGSSSSRSDKSSSKSKDDKEKDKKSKKDNDDHYSLSGRGNPNRRSTDRDSNDGSSSSKGSHNPSSSKSSNSKKDSKSSSKSESTSTSGESTSPSDKENMVQEHSSKTREALQQKPIVRIEKHLEVASPPRLPFVPDVTIKKPKFAANLEEAKRLMKMRKFLDEEQKRMNQEAALLLEFQANVRPSMSQVYSNIPGPELEFACVSNVGHSQEIVVQNNDNIINGVLSEQHNDVNIVLPDKHVEQAHYTNNELLTLLNDTRKEEMNDIDYEMVNETHTTSHDIVHESVKIPEKRHKIVLVAEAPNDVAENVGNHSDSAVHDIEQSLESSKCDNIEKDNIELILESTEIIVQTKNTDMAANKYEVLTENIKNRNRQNDNRKHLDFEVTIITEELSESEESLNEVADMAVTCEIIDTTTQNQKVNKQTENEEDSKINGEYKLYYFGEHEKYNAELERAQFNNFFKEYKTKTVQNNKLYLINCDSYEENIVREVSKGLGDFEIVTYHKNGHLKLPKNKNVIKNVNISREISLPLDTDYGNSYYDEHEHITHVFSPEKSECSFELSSDYDTKLQEMVNKTSRQEIMEIIIGNITDASPSKMPQIDYCTESNIDSDYGNSLKRKMSEETIASVNNNRPVLTPNKIRKLSSDQISSTTQENEETPNSKGENVTRSKYLGKARRVGLPRPKRTTLPNSPSSDKSVENYEQNTPTTPSNGKLRRQVQRYDTSDLYKPKLHYLSRRNHVT